MKNFDQWTEALSKEISTYTDEENIKTLWRMDEIFDEDIEEEE